MDMNWFRGLMTVIWMVLFIGIALWAYSPRRKRQFDEASRLALDEDQSQQGTPGKEEQAS